MPKYALYLESGPRRRKTMVHVLTLLGCIAQGPTTEDALQATPDAIRAYLRFLRRHGEAVKPDAPFTTVVAAHVTDGVWLGNGDPTPGFAPDFQPLSPKDLGVYLVRLGWLHADLLQAIRTLSRERLRTELPGTGRSIYRICEHISEAHGAYVRYTVGKVNGLAEALRAVRDAPDDLPDVLSHVWQITSARLAVMSAAERRQTIQHGQVAWTARRGLRRMIEHDWEHLQELSARLGG